MYLYWSKKSHLLCDWPCYSRHVSKEKLEPFLGSRINIPRFLQALALFSFPECSLPARLDAIKTELLCQRVRRCIAVKHQAPGGFGYGNVRTPERGERYRGESTAVSRRQEKWGRGLGGGVRQGSRPFLLFVITSPICRRPLWRAIRNGKKESGQSLRSVRSQRRRRKKKKTVTIWGAHFFSVPQGQVFGPLGIYGGLWPPLRSGSAAWLQTFSSFSFSSSTCVSRNVRVTRPSLTGYTAAELFQESFFPAPASEMFSKWLMEDFQGWDGRKTLLFVRNRQKKG